MPFVQPKERNLNPDIFQSPPQPDAQRPQYPNSPPSTNILDQTTQHFNVFIHGVVSTAPVQVLVDNGAAVTVISGEFYHKIINTSSSLQVSQILQSVKTANGTHIPVFARLYEPIRAWYRSIVIPILTNDNRYCSLSMSLSLGDSMFASLGDRMVCLVGRLNVC